MLRVGVIGLGVGEQHVRGYLNTGKCRVILCDLSPEKLAEARQKYPDVRVSRDAFHLSIGLVLPNFETALFQLLDYAELSPRVQQPCALSLNLLSNLLLFHCEGSLDLPNASLKVRQCVQIRRGHYGHFSECPLRLKLG